MRVVETIQGDWKLSTLLERYPALLDTIVDLAPAFHRLRNPIMRRVQTRLVTVEQAARIGGVDPADMVRRLNEAVGATVATPARTDRERATMPAWVDAAPVTRQVDARPLLANGDEPFHAIMAGARGLGAGEVLSVIVPFEPVPLLTALAKQGYAGWTRPVGDDWEALFLKPTMAGHASADPGFGAPAPTGGEGDADALFGAEVVTIDVSDLEPPQPMVRILEELAEMAPGTTLLVHHARRPMHLYPHLDELGYRHATREIGPGRVDIAIRKREGGE